MVTCMCLRGISWCAALVPAQCAGACSGALCRYLQILSGEQAIGIVRTIVMYQTRTDIDFST